MTTVRRRKKSSSKKKSNIQKDEPVPELKEEEIEQGKQFIQIVVGMFIFAVIFFAILHFFRG